MKFFYELTAVLSRFGCRKIPKPLTWTSEVEKIAKYEFCIKPAAGIAEINSGLAFRDYWAKKTPSEVHSLHCRLSATPSKVISILDIQTSNLSEQRVSGYLTTMLGNLSMQDVRLFLRFATGASVCIAPKLTVTFNNLSGLGRRPIAHTCNYLLELPTSYVNYDDFAAEFKAIFSSTDSEFSWRMDAIISVQS